jgi:hypothetical protein
MQYYWCCIILFSFPSFPKFHRVALLHLSLYMIILIFMYMFIQILGILFFTLLSSIIRWSFNSVFFTLSEFEYFL